MARLLALGKPRVVLLIVFTALAGMLLAGRAVPDPLLVVWGNAGIALAAMSAATVNHVLKARYDAVMARRRDRPLPAGLLCELHALFSIAYLTLLFSALVLDHYAL
jgi:protoheme IX farnesyltransferase